MPGARLQETGAVPEFINNWGASDAPPEMAFRLNGNAAEWSLITRARRAETSGDQNVTWSFNAQTAEVQLDAQLTTAAGSVFQYRLEAPPTLHVDSIAVLAEGANQAARWSQDQDGHISVFLAGPVSGHHELQLHGQMPLPRTRKLALPQVRLEEVRIQNSLVSLYRRPDVLVEVSGVAGLADVKTSDGRCRPGRSGTAGAVVLRRPGRRVPRAGDDQTESSPRSRRASDADHVRGEPVAHHVRIQLAGFRGAVGRHRVGRPRIVEGKREDQPGHGRAFAASSEERTSLVLSPSAAISGDGTFTLTGRRLPPRDLPSPTSR